MASLYVREPWVHTRQESSQLDALQTVCTKANIESDTTVQYTHNHHREVKYKRERGPPYILNTYCTYLQLNVQHVTSSVLTHNNMMAR